MRIGRWAGKATSGRAAWVIDRLESLASWPQQRFAAITYHRVDVASDDGKYPGLISASPGEFGQQMQQIAQRFSAVSIEEVEAAFRDEHQLPERAVLLTFDDAVIDFETHALPILKQWSLPAVVFVPTAYVGNADSFFWWDAIHAALTTGRSDGRVHTPVGEMSLATESDHRIAYATLRDYCLNTTEAAASSLALELCEATGAVPPPARVMSWDALRAAESSGIACCAHSRTHAHLDHLGPEAVRDEIGGSLDDVRSQIGTNRSTFAYPAGRLTDEVVGIAADTGVSIAFTTRRAVNTTESNALALGRINVSRTSGFGSVRVQMLPAADRLRRG